MSLNKRSLALFASNPFGLATVAASKVNWYTYASSDSLATILADGYFDDVSDKLAKGDVIFLIASADGTTPDFATLRVSSVSTGDVAVVSDIETEGGGARAVVPTAAGLTTGQIYHTDRMVVATSANAAHILMLPEASAATRGKEIWIWVVPSTNCELQTASGSGDTINNVDCSGGAVEALLTHSQLYIARQHLDTGWLLQAFTALGAVATAIVPD